jgi:uncharacterized protein YbjQ (UPF0145 family)
MILTTTDFVPGREIEEILGLVRGNTIRARHIGKDIMAAIKNITGGEVMEYTKLMAEAREEALDRLTTEAVQLGADAVINIRFITCEVMQGAAELLAYGTAVKFKIT